MSKRTFQSTTKVVYPDGGPAYDKIDVFSIPDDEFPCDTWPALTPDEQYDFLNNSGYWIKGWHEITPEQDAWIDDHQSAQGAQTETCVMMQEVN